MVRNGYHQPREVLTSAGAVEVTVPRVNDRRTGPQTGERKRFSSAILPPWARKTPKIIEVLPLLYLHGLSPGDFVPALGQFLGSAAGLPAAVVTRLTGTWKAGQRAFADAERDLSGVDYVYLWADGIHVNIRLEEHKLCLLVMIGVRADGRKELIAVAAVTASRRSRGPTCCATAPAAACEPRCWPLAAARWGSGAPCGKCSPRPAKPGAGSTRPPTCPRRCPGPPIPAPGKHLAEIWNAEDKPHVRAAVKAFDAAYGAKFPKASQSLTALSDRAPLAGDGRRGDQGEACAQRV